MCNDNITKEILELFSNEKSRKNTMNEELYLYNYIQLVDEYNITNFRILYSSEDRILSVHLIDIPDDQNRKDYLETFKEFLDSIMQESYSKLVQENETQDEPFTIYLRRNVKLMKRKRKIANPSILANELQFKVNTSFI
jgi:hypothetical protein